jgi:hypothetical protein
MKPITYRRFLNRSLPALLALPLAWTLAAQDQVDPFSSPAPPPARAVPAVNRAVDPSQLMHFDLEFPGGSPTDFLAAVAEASGKEVNAIIPRDCEDTLLPAIRVKNVNIVDLFEALEAASRRTVTAVTSQAGSEARGFPRGYTQFETSFGFRTSGVPSDDAIWYFYRKTPSLPPDSSSSAPDRRVRYFHLGRYLETYQLEDITTAIQTGWKMLRLNAPGQPVPEMNFHKDTQLLIAVGDPRGVEIIAQVLSELGRGAPRYGSAQVPPVPTPDEPAAPVPPIPAMPAAPPVPAPTPGLARPSPAPVPPPVAPPARER